MRVIPLFVGLALIPAGAALAQGSEDPALISRDVREAVTSIRTATERKDWAALQAYVPANSQWSRQVEALVTGAVGGTFVSFWRPESKAELEQLAIQVVASDIAAVRLPFTVRGATGIWGAVFRRSGDHWQLHCNTESFGMPLPAAPGCIAPR